MPVVFAWRGLHRGFDTRCSLTQVAAQLATLNRALWHLLEGCITSGGRRIGSMT